MHPTVLTSSQKGVFYEEQIYGDHVRLSGRTAAAWNVNSGPTSILWTQKVELFLSV